MFKLQKKNSTKTNKIILFNGSIYVSDFILALFCFICLELLLKDIYMSLIITGIFALFMIVFDKYFLKKEYERINLEKNIDRMIDLVMVYKINNSYDDSIIMAFNKLFPYMYEDTLSIDEKLSFIKGYLNSDKFEIFFKACKSSGKYLILSKIREDLKFDSSFYDDFIKAIDNYKIVLGIYFILEIVLLYFNTIWKEILINQTGLIIHTLIIILYIVINIKTFVDYKKYNKKKGINEFVRYFISYCEFEKPFFAYDDTCLIMGDFGQEMANKKNDFLSSSDNSYVNFISTYPLSDYSKFVFIIECLKRNILCYSYKLVLDKKEYEFNYYNKILKFLPLIFFIFAFVKEVIYK